MLTSVEHDCLEMRSSRILAGFLVVPLLMAIATAAAPKPDPKIVHLTATYARLPDPEIHECKQMKCWESKTFMLLQTDNWSNKTRQAWKALRWNMTNIANLQIGSWYTRTYAARHNLSYVLHSVPDMLDYHARFFLKEYVAQLYLPQVDFLVIMDFDVMVTNFEQDLRCLLEKWGFNCEDESDGKTPLFLQAHDPPSGVMNWNNWPNGSRVLNVNTGFFVMRNTERTRAVWKQYLDICTVNVTRWGTTWFWDQGFWNMDIRPTLAPHELKIADCEESNGFRWLSAHAKEWGCHGTYVTHAWRHGKDEVAREMFRRLMVMWTQHIDHHTAHCVTKPQDLWPWKYAAAG